MTRTEPVSHNAFLATAALLFTASAAVTIAWCASMSAMDGMTMPGGWTMSMMWMRMPGETWLDVTASFLGMWTVMMMAMMLPSLVPILGRYRFVFGNTFAMRVGIAYFLVWIAIGVLVFAVGIALTQIEMQVPAISRAVPLAIGIIVLVAGALQFTAWKTHHLACWREGPDIRTSQPTAWRHGLRLGLQCSYGCANLTTILLVIGMMDLRAMLLVTVAITAERLSSQPVRVARATGMIVVAIGMFLIVQAACVV